MAVRTKPVRIFESDHAPLRLLAELERRSPRDGLARTGADPVAPTLVAFSLHVGRRRGATWHRREAGVIWLLAVGYHREGHIDDAYAYFARLKAAGRLLPDREDMLAFV